MPITLRDITMDNFSECIKLSVKDEQKAFVAGNTYSLAEAKADGVSLPYAVYAEGRMVGFVMYDFEPKESRGYITRLMIDARFQGKGHGRAAMAEILKRLRSIPDCQEIQTSYAPTNARAAKLYESLGFQRTGEEIDGETVVRMAVTTPEEAS